MATFYIEAIENGTTITLSKMGYPSVGTARYGINNTSPSTNYSYGNSISLNAGDKCYWTITKTTTALSTSAYIKFTANKTINVGGELSDLIGGESKIPREYCFYSLFRTAPVVDASNLILVNDFNSKNYCYYYMFYGCESLISPPELPATTLTNYCYSYMFRSCKKLVSAPELPATTLADYCYSNMFGVCSCLKLSTTQTTECQYEYRIPGVGTGTTANNALQNMFASTGGTFKGTPAINTTYYVNWTNSPPVTTKTVTVTYNGNTLAETEEESDVDITYNSATIASAVDGTKTLKCAGKMMSTDVTVGSKTLSCAGKYMVDDVTVTVE